MKPSFRIFLPASIIFVILVHGCAFRHAVRDNCYEYINLDTVHAGQFDTGKMWTFDFPPAEYFKRTYGFTPDKEWFEKARLSVLRLPNCSASFISEDGLVMTNHHCARAALDSINRPGEQFVLNGFYAAALEDERKVSGIYADQLLIIDDVTKEVQQAFDSGPTENAKVANQLFRIFEIQRRYSEKYKTIAPQDSMVFSVISFYNGGRFSLYGYKRFTDIRLVYAPEEAMAFFGGDADNFTYPRYDFDCAFFRIYENNKPLKTKNFFKYNRNGTADGDAVFVIGNPGTTNRFKTIAQLQYLRDFEYPENIKTLERLGSIYSGYIEQHPEKKIKYINTIFGIENSKKAFNGYLTGLRDPILMAKKKDFEKDFKEKISEKKNLSTLYSNVWKDIAKYQSIIAESAPELNALRLRTRYFPKSLSITADLIDSADISSGKLSESAQNKFSSADIDIELEKQLLSYRLEVIKSVEGKNQVFEKFFAGRSPLQAAEQIINNSYLASADANKIILAKPAHSILTAPDPLISLTIAIKERTRKIQGGYSEILGNLQASMQFLGKALYEIYGTSLPPDATFSLRISDGTVKGYEYNGTVAPPITTFYGMYDRAYSFKGRDSWKLPERWINPPSTFNMNTPFNFISTSDIIGGNSGSSVVNKDLQVVGLVFDGNIESLPGNFIFDETKNRTVSVHASGIIEALDKIYKADRLVRELNSGKIAQ